MTNDAKLGTLSLDAAYLGGPSSPVDVLYLGSAKLWPNDVAPPVMHHALVTATSGSNLGTSYDFGFTPAAGSLLVALAVGEVTWTTPAGWTLQDSSVVDGASYAFVKTADGTETGFTVDHNGTGNAAFPNLVEVWEFPAGSTIVASNHGHTGNPGNLAAVGGLTGTTSFVASVAYGTGAFTGTVAVTGMSPASEVSHVALPGTTDGIVYSSWRADGFTGTAPPAGAVTAGGVNGTAETLVVVVRQP